MLILRWSPSALCCFIVFMERAQRRLLVHYPKRQVGNRMFGGESSHLPLKLNVSGVIPPIFASSILLLPTTVANFNGAERARLAADHAHLYRPAASRSIWCSTRRMIIFFAFFYTSIVFNPEETAENLKKYGGFIPGHPSGKEDRRIHRLRADAHHGGRARSIWPSSASFRNSCATTTTCS